MNPETLINSFELNQNYTSDGHSVIAGQNFTTYSYKDQPIIKYFFKSQYYSIMCKKAKVFRPWMNYT